MRRFQELFAALDSTNRTGGKQAALVEYFREAPPEDAAWAVFFLTGRKLRQAVTSTELRRLAAEEAGIPEWLFEECYDAVGDLAETVALALPPGGEDRPLPPLHVWVRERLLPLREMDDNGRRAVLIQSWKELSPQGRFVWNKLITGGMRLGVSRQLVVRALSEVSGLAPGIIAHRLMGEWEPSAEFFRELLSPDTASSALSQPYPFFLAHPLEDAADTLGEPGDWQAEWKWDGIRAQIVRRDGETFIWSRGEELMTDRFPELAGAAEGLPDGTVLDGEILPWKDGHVLPFAVLQTRIGRKSLTRAVLQHAPVMFMAFDLLETEGRDVRENPLKWRRRALEEILQGVEADRITLSPVISFADWEELEQIRSTSRDRGVEGVMLKRLDSAYGVGRPRGDWWKWKIEPLSVDCVLMYAQRGHGKRASLYTDYTFGVWDGDRLVPFAKAYSGLTDEEIREVDAFVRRNTVERFGPVRSVRPELVFELAFEGIQRSTRHRSGVAVRFPRMVRWRRDKRPADADTLQTVLALLERTEASR
ncbi:MAG: ATP-dependent DNA ligase [Armatimonadota bacterium]|nr:MAG: ATP-dependent DNA ligase [Armatimonadota bacterium]